MTDDTRARMDELETWVKRSKLAFDHGKIPDFREALNAIQRLTWCLATLRQQARTIERVKKLISEQNDYVSADVLLRALTEQDAE